MEQEERLYWVKRKMQNKNSNVIIYNVQLLWWWELIASRLKCHCLGFNALFSCLIVTVGGIKWICRECTLSQASTQAYKISESQSHSSSHHLLQQTDGDRIQKSSWWQYIFISLKVILRKFFLESSIVNSDGFNGCHQLSCIRYYDFHIVKKTKKAAAPHWREMFRGGAS